MSTTYTKANTYETAEYTAPKMTSTQKSYWDSWHNDRGIDPGHALKFGHCGANWQRLISAARRDKRPGPFDYLLNPGNRMPEDKPTPRPRPVTTPKPTPTEPTLPGVDWESLYHVAEANVILLQGENQRLRARLAQLGVSVTGPLGLATIR